MNYQSSIKTLDFFPLYERFISDSRSGRRLQVNGRMISKGTINNYLNTGRLLRKFCLEKEFSLRIREIKRMNRKLLVGERNYWRRFYRKFTTYLYRELHHFDNYVGSIMKNIRVFFHYLQKELLIDTGDFYKNFHVCREDVPVIALFPGQLRDLIFNKELEKMLSKRLLEVKDFFVFGCTVGLRFSDLVRLNARNLRREGTDVYLQVRSQKSGNETLLKLPSFATEIAYRYLRKYRTLLPPFNRNNVNEYLKQLMNIAGLSDPVGKTRTRQGRLKNINFHSREYRFCDLVSSHCMRRTAVTTLLSLGVPELIVRKITGHTSHSREFNRYILISQQYMDKTTTLAFERIYSPF